MEDRVSQSHINSQRHTSIKNRIEQLITWRNRNIKLCYIQIINDVKL